MTVMDKRTHRPEKIRWSPRLPPVLLKRLYDSDARGFQDLALCDAVGMRLYMRCRTFALVHRGEVECPRCGDVFVVSREGASGCPQEGCGWSTTWSDYAQSIRNHYAYPGGATGAFLSFYRRYPTAATYQAKMLLIDRLIHSFHLSEKTGFPTKSVASKLLEGNKKAVVAFLDALATLSEDDKEQWRQVMRQTIDGRIVRTDSDAAE
jgi:hypothetical protein